MSRMTKDPRSLGAIELGLEDSFHFWCSGCGNCCRGRTNDIADTNIFLSGPDVARISSFLGVSSREVLEKYALAYMDEELGLTVYRLRARLDGSCSLLRGGRCTVYPARPRTCALYPLGRGMFFKLHKWEIVFDTCRYSLNQDREPNYKCGKEAIYTVSDWLAQNGVPEDDEADKAWYERLTKLSMAGKDVKAADKPQFLTNALATLYFEWEMECDQEKSETQ